MLKHKVDNYFFKHNPIPILVIDPENGMIIDFNSAAIQYYGYSEEVFRNLSLSNIIIASEELIFEEMQSAVQEKKFFFNTQQRLANNEIRNVEVNYMSIPVDGNELLFLMIANTSTSNNYCNQLMISKHTLEQMISERTEALEKELAIKNVLLESMLEAVIVCDEMGKLIILNETAKKWYGKDVMNIPKDEWPNEYNLYHYDGVTKISVRENPLLRALEGDSVEDMELLIRSENQPDRYVLCSGRQIKIDRGDLIGAVLVHRDVTDQKINELKLREINVELENRNLDLINTIKNLEKSYDLLQASESKFKSIFKMTPSGIILFDTKGILREYNDSFIRIIGSSREKLIDLNMLMFPNEHFKKALMECLNGQDSKYEGLYKSNTSGKETFVCVRFTPVRVGECRLIGGIGLVYDLSELKEKEYQAEHQKKVFMALFKNSPIPTVQFGKNNRIVSINNAFTEAFGYVNEEVESEDLDKLIASGSMYESAQSYTTKVFSGESVRYKAFRYGKCKKEIYADIIGVPIEINHEIIGGFALYNDITLQEKNRIELIEAKEASEMANKAKSYFLENMSHEIRTPMNGFIGMVQLLQMTNINEEQKEYLRLAYVSAEALKGVVTDILDYTKIEEERLVLEKIVIHPIEILMDIVGLFKPTALQKKLDIYVKIDEEVPHTITGDPLRLKQVLSNLIGNAIKFTNHGKVEINLERLESINGKRELLRFSINDTGIGIAKEEMKSIFTRFNQVDVGTTRKYGGSGLGLAISKNLIELMGGEICVESESKKGSRFSFTCPVE